MIDASAVAVPLVLDATCLSHFARADRLDVLRDLLIGRRCWTTETVLAELNRGVADYPKKAAPARRRDPGDKRATRNGLTPAATLIAKGPRT